jgi:iron-sulfur cluster insertion protein
MNASPPPPPVTVSENAAKRIATLMSQENAPDGGLRIQVKGGGCSGFQYDFAMEETIGVGDEVVELNGARLVIDPMSLMYLAGSEIDFKEEMIGSSFTVGNPNATAACSCGSSFAV